MIKHINSKIQNAIQLELFKAKSSIKIAVAWFTNELLLQPLILKLQNGISVELIINDDEINRGGENSLDFTEFTDAGGIIHWNKSRQLMHDKFCIIDNSIIITGSYNWTNKAEYNNETITIIIDNKESVDFFCKNFDEIASKIPSETVRKRSLQNTVDKKSQIERELYYYDPNGAKYSKDGTILYKGANIKDFNINPYTREIKEGAFFGFDKLEEISLANIVVVGDSAFKGCSALTTITCPLYKCSFGKEVFQGCTSLKHIGCNIHLSSTINSLKCDVISEGMFRECQSLKEIDLWGVKSIEDSAFEGCSELETIYNDYVNRIGNKAYRNCSSLNEFKLNASQYGENVFEGSQIKELVVVRQTLYDLGYKPRTISSVISGCTHLTRIVIASYISCIQAEEFKNLTTLEEFFIKSALDLTVDRKAFYGCVHLKRIEINAIKNIVIKDYAFKDCHSLSEFSYLGTITDIQESAFEGCISLSKIELRNGLLRIGEGAFSGCSSLRQLLVPNTVREIHNWAFSGCSSLQKILIPNTIKLINLSIIKGCKSLKQIFTSNNAKQIPVPDINSSFFDYIVTKSHYLANDINTALREKNLFDITVKKAKSVFDFTSFRIDSESHTLYDNEVITIPENFSIFQRQTKRYIKGSWGIPFLDKNAPMTEYINVLNDRGCVVEFYPSVLFRSLIFEVDEFGKNIRENGKYKIHTSAGEVIQYIRSKRSLGFGTKGWKKTLELIAGCQIRFHVLKYVRSRRYDVEQSVATRDDVEMRIICEWSFVGTKRPVDYNIENGFHVT